ncbi:MAG: GNAT family N-acetyltransferase [Terricaulis sp.]
MSAPPATRVADTNEAARVCDILTDAFADEAGLNYWLRQGQAKDHVRRRFFGAAVRDVVHPGRTLWLAESAGEPVGAALWLGVGQKAYHFSLVKQLQILPLLYSIAGVAGGARGTALGEKLNALHPQEPHAHLVFLGVSPHAQGRGVGSAILKETLAPLDASGTPALLEATTERNVALYRRHGFDVVENLRLSDLHVRIMWRAPR